MNIFVGNLSFKAKEADVYKAFVAFGTVASVAIVMEKKGKKSRGFGFVEMPDESEALAAIAGLHGKELLGRPINVMPALSKKPKSEFAEEKNKHRPMIMTEGQGNLRHNNERKNDFWSKQDFKRTGGYKRGRRTRSFMMRRAEAGITEPVSERKYKDNPMRWRKKQEQPKPWQKIQGESKPWRKAEGESKPWQKRQGESKPWEKTKGKSRPWMKTEGKSKPRRKSNTRAQQSKFKSRKNSTSNKR